MTPQPTKITVREFIGRNRDQFANIEELQIFLGSVRGAYLEYDVEGRCLEMDLIELMVDR